MKKVILSLALVGSFGLAHFASAATLSIVGLCSDNASTTLNWQVTNASTTADMPFSYEKIAGLAAVGNGLAPAGSSATFTTNANYGASSVVGVPNTSGPNTVRISWTEFNVNVFEAQADANTSSCSGGSGVVDNSGSSASSTDPGTGSTGSTGSTDNSGSATADPVPTPPPVTSGGGGGSGGSVNSPTVSSLTLDATTRVQLTASISAEVSFLANVLLAAQSLPPAEQSRIDDIASSIILILEQEVALLVIQ